MAFVSTIYIGENASQYPPGYSLLDLKLESISKAQEPNISRFSLIRVRNRLNKLDKFDFFQVEGTPPTLSRRG